MIRQFDNVVKFAELNKGTEAGTLVSKAEDFAKHKINEMYGNKYSVETMDREGKAIDLVGKGEKLHAIFMAELERRSGVKRSDFVGDMVSYAMQPTVSATYSAMNKIIVDAMIPIFYAQTSLNLIATTHFGGYGDVFEFEVGSSNLYSASRVGRGQKHLKAQARKKTTKTIATEAYGLTSITTVAEILSNRVNIAEESVTQARSMAYKIYAVAVDKFKTETELIDGTAYCLTNFAEGTFLELMRKGSAVAGEKLTIIGDAVALKTLLPASAWTRIDLGDAFNTSTGYMTVWNGYNVLAFDVVSDGTIEGIVGLPTDRIYGLALGDKGVHIGLGATMAIADGMFDNNDLSVNTTLIKEIGVEIASTTHPVMCKLA